MRAADALDLLFLNRAQQLRLQLVLQIADLVEEERASRRQLELAELLPDRAGEGAFLVAEERALDKLLGNRREVDRHERCGRPPGLAVNQPREQFLSCAALAEDEHRRGDLGDLLHQLHDRTRDCDLGRRRTHDRSARRLLP